ncbi:MAG: bifunctional diaminohydroxyphosphoribosylaminopyrimidine deaminase/5-amino-6-(5-phosphoribosylamino)uracil reductase RibD [bacterium]|nr:bifunctional diaminohydroxyphosphoribosylaminopyrimidine deaminase/5-amino-6-(5-phosphoribosylamino)uracil reductase RibD [bacterium]
MSRRALSDNRDLAPMGRGDGPSDSIGGSAGDEVPAEQRCFVVSEANFMREAIALALETQPHPNPRVGAVVVAAGEVIANGAHLVAGQPHAEAVAIEEAGDRARGATVYVTLEPCSHFGKTPPCSQALIAAGVTRVVVGAVDPDERVHGSGIAELRAAGIEVLTGVLAEEVEAADPGYFHHRRTGLPLVTLKLATTMDGQIAAADRTSKWISGDEAREDGHRLRAEADVIIAGAGTVIDDDPRLDVRLDGYQGRQPRPVIVAGNRELPQAAALYDRNALVYADRRLPIDLEQVEIGANGRVDVSAMIEDLGKRGYVSALVEGGATLASALVEGGHVDRIVFYLAAKLGVGQGIGAFAGEFKTITDAVPLLIETVDRIGTDLRIQAKVGS